MLDAAVLPQESVGAGVSDAELAREQRRSGAEDLQPVTFAIQVLGRLPTPVGGMRLKKAP
jgi:hypothetical protein